MAFEADLSRRPAVLLVPHAVAKPWGRIDLGPWGLGLDIDDVPIGEIHHHPPVDAADPELLVKTLFTGERLSVQVHPGDDAARARGHRRGKDEAWIVLAADPGAVIGLGLKTADDTDALRAAALDGSIVDKVEWHPCAAGEVFFTPAGTVHAIGAGVTLFEVQQNSDPTYRLFDYGRGRPLQLDDALAVVDPTSRRQALAPVSPGNGRELLVEGPNFCIERLRCTGSGVVRPAGDGPAWIAIIDGDGTIDGQAFVAGQVWFAINASAIDGMAEIVVAYSGAAAAPDLWMPS
jgi:mannose-6-phosphate isomerase